MMDRQLLVKRLLWRAENVFGDEVVVTRDGGDYDSCTYAELGHRVRRLVGALHGLGVRPGDRVLTLAWNSRRHLEAYFAVPGMGAVLHTGNQRLSLDQLAFTINHAQDRVVLVDPGLLPVLESVRPQLSTVREVVVLGPIPEDTGLPNLHSYEDLLAAAEPVEDLSELDENTAAALCYTSGTTGTRRVCSTATAARCCTRWLCARPGRSASPLASATCWSRRCRTSTRGACRTRARWPGHG